MLNKTIAAAALAMIVGFNSSPSFSQDNPVLDIDGDGVVRALTDGILILNYTFGGRSSFSQTAISTTATRSAEEMDNYLNELSQDGVLDVDGNGMVNSLTDGLLIVRYLFGFNDAALTEGVLGSGASRTTGTELGLYLKNFAPAPDSVVWVVEPKLANDLSVSIGDELQPLTGQRAEFVMNKASLDVFPRADGMAHIEVDASEGSIYLTLVGADDATHRHIDLQKVVFEASEELVVSTRSRGVGTGG